MGKALLEAAIEDIKARGAKGVIAWGISLPFWMRAAWYKKQGFKVADRRKGMVLVYKKFTEDAKSPKWIRYKNGKGLVTTRDKVTITTFKNGWCPVANMTYERIKRIAEEHGDKVEFKTIDTFCNPAWLSKGISDAIYINKKMLRFGPPPSYKKIKKKVDREVRKLKSTV